MSAAQAIEIGLGRPLHWRLTAFSSIWRTSPLAAINRRRCGGTSFADYRSPALLARGDIASRMANENIRVWRARASRRFPSPTAKIGEDRPHQDLEVKPGNREIAGHRRRSKAGAPGAELIRRVININNNALHLVRAALRIMCLQSNHHALTPSFQSRRPRRRLAKITKRNK